jgi:hypothetical protein
MTNPRKATIDDYNEITRQTKHLTNAMRTTILAQGSDALKVVGGQLMVTLPLEMVSEECKKAKKRK